MKRFVALVLLSIMVGHPTIGSSQMIASQLPLQSGNVPSVAKTERNISVDFKGVPIRTALKTIVERSGIELLYSSIQLPDDHRVTYRAVGVTAEEALGRILNRTALRVVKLTDGRLRLEQVQTAINTQGVIVGTVTDAKTGKGIARANVSIGTDTRSVVASEEGSYRITGVTAGMHTVTVRIVGYAKQTRTVIVGEGAAITVDFKMEPSANVLDQVVVTGTVAQTELKAVPNAITVITAKQIEERGITRIDQLFRGEIPGLFAPRYQCSS